MTLCDVNPGVFCVIPLIGWRKSSHFKETETSFSCTEKSSGEELETVNRNASYGIRGDDSGDMIWDTTLAV
jgi:hypothetical protein